MKKLISLYCQKVLPLVYDESLSYYELLCKVVQAINELIAEDEKIKSWLNEIDEYIAKELKKDADEILTEWLNNGTIDKIIGENYLAKDQSVIGYMTDNYAVNEVIACALTYLNNNDKLFYGNNTALNVNMDSVGQGSVRYAIDCSTLVCLALNGVPFNKSRYALGGDRYNNIPDYPWAENIYDTGGEAFRRYANMIAKTFWDSGKAYYTRPDFSNVKQGDLLFWKGDEETPGSFRNIIHVAFFINKTSDGKIRYLEANNYERPVTLAAKTITPDLHNEIFMGARPNLNGIQYSYYENLVDGNHDTVLSTSNTPYYSVKTISEGFYTIMIKGSGNTNPIVEIGGSALNSYYVGNNIYMCYLRVSNPVNTINVKIPSNTNFTLEWISVIKGLIEYPVPIYIKPLITGYVDGAISNQYTMTSSYTKVNLENINGSNYLNSYHLSNDGCITCEESGKYAVYISSDINAGGYAQMRLIKYKKGESGVIPQRAVALETTEHRDTISLFDIVNMNSGDRFAVQFAGNGIILNANMLVYRIA